MEAKALWINVITEKPSSVFCVLFSPLDIHGSLNLGGLVVGALFLELDFTFISVINPGQLFGFCYNAQKSVVRRSYSCKALLWLGTVRKSGNWVLIWCVVYNQTS